MSHIDNLLAELCPNGVEFRTVGDIADVGTGSSDRKDATEGGEYPFYVRSREIMRIGSYQFDEEAILIPGEGGIGDIHHYVSGRYALHQRAYRISFRIPDLMTKFAYYYFTANFKTFILSKAVTATVVSIRKPMITDFRIPVPPVEVQCEIVTVLDRFTALEAELEAHLDAELGARRRQYEQYRDSMLSFGAAETVRWLPMAEVGTFTRGRRFVKDDIVDRGLPAIHYGEIYTRYGTSTDHAVNRVRAEIAPRLRFAQPGDVVIAAVGETVEDVGKAVAWLGDGPVAVHDDCFAFSHEENPKFIAYCMQTAALNSDKQKYVSRAKVKRLSAEGLGRLVIPLPSLEEQERIVQVLDKFDALVNDLTIGLPAELKARRQQYEYYRDRLLTFNEIAA